MDNLILTKLDGYIGTIILNNRAKHNALSKKLLQDLLMALRSFQDEEVRVVVLRAPEDATVWSAGHDISELSPNHDPLHYSEPLERTLRALKKYPRPIIAMVHGSVWGGATELVLCCDLVIGDETCQFAITPANLGLPFNTMGLLDFIRRLPLNLVKEMFFTAAPVKASAAYRWGILNHLVDSAELERFTYDLARLIASKAPLTISVTKEQLRVLAETQPLSLASMEALEELRQMVIHTEDFAEGLRAFKEKRHPVFQGK